MAQPSYFAIISRSFLFRMRNVWDKSYWENQNTRFLFNKVPPPQKKNSCSLWDNVGKCGTARQVTVKNVMLRMRTSCWIPKSTNIHSEYVILFALPQQLWLHERTSFPLHVHRLSSCICNFQLSLVDSEIQSVTAVRTDQWTVDVSGKRERFNIWFCWQPGKWISHSVNRASWYTYVSKTNKMNTFS